MTASVDDIIDKVRRLITLPPDDTLFQTTDFVSFMNDVLIEKIYPRLMKIRDDYCLVRDVFNLQNSQAQDLYPTGVMPIPSRAWGNTLREIKYIDVSGNYYKVNPYFLEDLDLYQARNLAFSSAYQKGFIPYNSGIKLIPPPIQDNGSIEMYYIITPSILVDNAIEGESYVSILNMQFDTQTNIASYTTTAVSLTVQNDDASDSAYLQDVAAVGDEGLFDIYNSQTGMLLATNVVLTRLPDSSGNSNYTGICTIQTGTNIISPSVPELTNFQLGGYPVVTPTYDATLYLVPAGYNAFTPIPPVLDNLLIYELAMKILSAQGYVEELQTFKAEHDDLRKDLLSQMAMRVECEPYVISNKRGIRSNIIFGPLRGRRSS